MCDFYKKHNYVQQYVFTAVLKIFRQNTMFN